jgi:hypothetical protein
MFLTVPLSIIRNLSLHTQQWYMSYSLRAASGRNVLILLVSCNCNLYVLLCVQRKTPDDGQKNCPKHVEFYSKNEFEKLVHLVGSVRPEPAYKLSPNLYDIHHCCVYSEKLLMMDRVTVRNM